MPSKSATPTTLDRVTLATPTHVVEALLLDEAVYLTSTPVIPYPILTSACEGDYPEKARPLCTSTKNCDCLLAIACFSKAMKIIEMILKDYKHRLSKDTIGNMLAVEYVSENLDIVSLFFNNLDRRIMRPICIDQFNSACDLGFDRTLEHLLQNCKHLIKIEDFAFNPFGACRHPKVVALLYEAYGDALIELYPSWARLIKADQSECPDLRHSGTCANIFYSICNSCDIVKARELCGLKGDNCDRLLIAALDLRSHEIANMILKDFGHRLSRITVRCQLTIAYAEKTMNIAGMIVDNLSTEMLRSAYVDTLNNDCCEGRVHIVKHLLQHKRGIFKIDDLKLQRPLLIKHDEIVDLLYEAFGDALLKRYPSLTRPKGITPFNNCQA